jgi:hypothetical protein
MAAIAGLTMDYGGSGEQLGVKTIAVMPFNPAAVGHD